MTVGRERPSDVLLGIGTVSGTHATFSVDTSGCLFVTDLGSSNGTDVGGRGVLPGVPTALTPGDVVTLGDPHLARYEVVGTKDALGDALAGFQGASAGAEAKVRAVGEAWSTGTSAARDAQAAFSGVGDVFRGFGGGGGGGSGGVGGGSKGKGKGASSSVLAAEEADEEVEGTAEEMREEEDQEVAVKAMVGQEVRDDGAVVDADGERGRGREPAAPSSSSWSISSEERVMLTPVGWGGPAVELEPGAPLVLGSGRRRGDADVILTVGGVDSAHASVLRIGGAVYIEDLGSTNGTFVGGRQIKPGFQYALTRGADVQLGDGGCAFTVVCLASSEDLDFAPAAPAAAASPSAVRREDSGAGLATVSGRGGGGLARGGDDGRDVGQARYHTRPSHVSNMWPFHPYITPLGSASVL